MFSDVFSGFNIHQQLIPNVSLDETIQNNFSPLFLTIAIVVANDDRKQSFAQVYNVIKETG